jgi:hypothetical protein
VGRQDCKCSSLVTGGVVLGLTSDTGPSTRPWCSLRRGFSSWRSKQTTEGLADYGPHSLVVGTVPHSTQARSTAEGECHRAKHERLAMSVCGEILKLALKGATDYQFERLVTHRGRGLVLGPTPPSTKARSPAQGRVAPGQARGDRASVRRGLSSWLSKQGTANSGASRNSVMIASCSARYHLAPRLPRRPTPEVHACPTYRHLSRSPTKVL